MPAVSRVLRNTPVESLRAYFDFHDVNFGKTVNWNRTSQTILSRCISKAIEELADEKRAGIIVDFERVDEMTDEVGKTAAEEVIAGRQEAAFLENAYDRALWLLLNDAKKFRRAEETRYADHYRQGRIWTGFVGPKGLSVSRDPDHQAVFSSRIRDWFKSSNVHLEVFDRTRPMVDGEKSQLIQVVVYREGMPGSFLEFEDGTLISRNHRPVLEFVLTYEPVTGVIEVLAQEKKSRARLARLFAETLLQRPILGMLLPLRQYDLSPLLQPPVFPTDPQDGIAATFVETLRLKHVADKKGAIKIESPRDDETLDMYQRSKKWFPGCDPLQNGFFVHQAKISVLFRPDNESRQGKVVPVELTLPNGCTLKGRTEKERIICEKYLPRWGLVREV